MRVVNISFSKIQRPHLLLFGIWALLQVFFFVNFGLVTTVGEPPKYIEQARNMLDTGQFTSSNFWLYYTEIFFIMIAIKLKLGWFFVVAVHLAFSLWAQFTLYRFSARLFQPQTALCISLLFLANFPMHQYNVFLQTESLFFSFSILFTAYLLQSKELTTKSIIIIVCTLAVLSITRPTGLLFIPATVLYLFFRFFSSFSMFKKILIVAGSSVVFLFLLNKALSSGGELNFILPYLNEHIICGVPTIDHVLDTHRVDEGNSLYGLLHYITHHFGQFCKMTFYRSKAFLGLTRTYFSTGHNLFLVVFYYSIFILALAGMGWWRRNQPHALLFFILHILATWGTVILTCDDWHNRFFLTISPWLFLLAAPVIRFINKRTQGLLNSKIQND